MMSQIIINQKNFNRFSKRLEILFKEKTNGQELGYLEAQEFMSKVLGLKNLHEFKKLMKIQENHTDFNEEVYDPFAQPQNVEVSLVKNKHTAVQNQNIVDSLMEKILKVDNPYIKYNSLQDSWHTPSHGINVTNQEDLNELLTDIEKSQSIWETTGVYLGVIFQAVEKDTVIDTGYPIGLVPKIDGDNLDEERHVTSQEIKEFINSYKQYLTSQFVEKLENISVEIKPFYAFSEQKINYELVSKSDVRNISIISCKFINKFCFFS